MRGTLAPIGHNKRKKRKKFILSKLFVEIEFQFDEGAKLSRLFIMDFDSVLKNSMAPKSWGTDALVRYPTIK